MIAPFVLETAGVLMCYASEPTKGESIGTLRTFVGGVTSFFGGFAILASLPVGLACLFFLPYERATKVALAFVYIPVIGFALLNWWLMFYGSLTGRYL